MSEIGFALLTHSNPAQSLRLVNVLNEMFDAPPIACHHDFSKCPLSTDTFPENVRFVRPHINTGWGDYSVVKAGMAAFELLHRGPRPPRWTYLLSGTDYPVKSADRILQDLRATSLDAFIDHRLIDYGKASSFVQDYGNGFDRSEYIPLAYDRYCAIRIPRPSRRRPWVIPREGPYYFRQPWLIKRFTFFSDSFQCYAGEHWLTVNAKAMDHMLAKTPENVALLKHLSKRVHVDECAYQSLLLNAPQLNVSKDNLRYIDWSNHAHLNAHPNGLGLADLDSMLRSSAHFARKITAGSPLLDELDAAIGVVAARGANLSLRHAVASVGGV